MMKNARLVLELLRENQSVDEIQSILKKLGYYKRNGALFL